MTFRVTLPDDPDLPLKEEDKHQTEKILEAPVRTPADTIEELRQEIMNTPDMNAVDIFNESIPQLISIVEEVNPPEKTKVIGKLRGALELFNQK